jgi:hypothetical protein
MRHSAELNLKIKSLREYEFIFKTALAHESGDPGVLFAEKNRGSKISWDSPFKIELPKYNRKLAPNKAATVQ